MAVDQKALIENTYPIQRKGDLGIKRFAAYLAASAVDGSLPAYTNDPDAIEAIFQEFRAFALMSDTQAESVFVDQMWALGFGGAFVQSDAYLFLSNNDLGIQFNNSLGFDVSLIRAPNNNVGHWADGNLSLYDTTTFDFYATADVVTNYSRLRTYYDSGAQKFFIQTEAAGTGTEQALQLASNGGIIELGYNSLLTVYGRVNAGFLTVTPNQYQHQILHEIQVDSGETATMKLLPVHNETLTAGYAGYFLDATTTVLGSGNHYYASWRKGGTHYFDFFYGGTFFMHDVDVVPGNPVAGINIYSEGQVLKYKNPAGTISLVGVWGQDATLATYLTPIGYSNIVIPTIIRYGSSSTTEAFTAEWQNGGGLGGGAIFTSLDSGNTGYFQLFQTTNRIAQGGYTGSGGRWAVNSNSFTGGASGGYTGILHLRTVDSATEAGLLITSPTTPGNTIHVLRVADAANVFHIMDNTGRSYAPNGTAALPSWSFLNDSDCGLYRVTTNELAISTNAARLVGFNTTQVVWPNTKSAIWYNTADESVNTIFGSIGYNSGVFEIGSNAAGTGTASPLRLRAYLVGGASYSELSMTRGSTPFLSFALNMGTGLTGSFVQFSGTSTASSSRTNMFAITPTINQTGSAAWTGLLVNATVTADVGTDNRLLDLQNGGNSQFYVNKSGAFQTSNPSGGTAQLWKLGNYTAGAAVQGATVRVEINGVAVDLLAV